MSSARGIFLSLFLVFGSAGCGVKGRPLPPDQEAPIGRGRPSFQGATEAKEGMPLKPEGEETKKTKSGWSQ